MANLAKNYNISNIIQGPADIFIDVQPPPSAVPPIEGENTWALNTGTYQIDSNGQPTDNGSDGFHVGLSDNVVLHISPKFEEIRADQFVGAIDAAFVSTETEIDVVVKEMVLSKLSKYFTSLLGTYTQVDAGVDIPQSDVLQIGNPISSTAVQRSMLMIGADRTSVGQFWVINAYKTVLKAAIKTDFHRGKEVTWALKFACLADITRTLSDMSLQVVRTLP